MAKKSTAQEEQEHKEAVAAATAGLPPKIVKVSEELTCDLNEVEWNNKARELAEAHKEVARQEERKKTVSSGLSNDVKIAKAKESKLADIVSSRQEQREVTVEVKYDYDLGRVIKTRTDNDTVISDREMTDQEKQAELDLQDANNFIEGRHDDESKADEGGSPFDDDEDADESDVRTVPNLDEMGDVDLSSLADELGVDISDAEVKGDAEATRENVKLAIREEIERRPDLEEQGAGIDESELED